MAQADPQASSTNLQPRRSTRQPKPATRDPHFIYTDFQHHLAHLADDGDLAASPSVFTDTQRLPLLKETKKKRIVRLLNQDRIFQTLAFHTQIFKVSCTTPICHIKFTMRFPLPILNKRFRPQAKVPTAILPYRHPPTVTLIKRFDWPSYRKTNWPWS